MVIGKDEEIHALFVDRNQRGKGAGKELLNFAVKHVYNKYREVKLGCLVDNVKALNFYKSFGFEKIGVRNISVEIEGKKYFADEEILELKKEKIVNFEQTNTANNARTWQFNFANQNSCSSLDRIVRGIKTIEVRALNPEESDRYFGNIKIGDKAIFHNKETREDLEFVITKVNFYKNLADAVDKNLDFTKVGVLEKNYTTEDLIPKTTPKFTL